MYLDYYKKQLGEIPSFMEKYLESPSLQRLKNIGYFCGMDFASKDVYQFQEWISRYDHSLTVALMTYKLTGDKKQALAGLFHDVGTPCFSHAIDYMNGDYEKQESTEEYTEKIIQNDRYLQHCLEEDGLSTKDIANFKQYPVVDNERPKICADRLDGIILTGIGWTKSIQKEDIDRIISSMQIYQNPDGEAEIGFHNPIAGERVAELSREIDSYCHSSEDNYMMNLLGRIAKLGIQEGLFTYEDLYKYTEDELFAILAQGESVELQWSLNKFYNVKKDEIPEVEIPNLKRRFVRPIICGRRVF